MMPAPVLGAGIGALVNLYNDDDPWNGAGWGLVVGTGAMYGAYILDAAKDADDGMFRHAMPTILGGLLIGATGAYIGMRAYKERPGAGAAIGLVTGSIVGSMGGALVSHIAALPAAQAREDR